MSETIFIKCYSLRYRRSYPTNIEKRTACDNDPQTFYPITNKWLFVNVRLWIKQHFTTCAYAERWGEPG